MVREQRRQLLGLGLVGGELDELDAADRDAVRHGRHVDGECRFGARAPGP